MEHVLNSHSLLQVLQRKEVTMTTSYRLGCSDWALGKMSLPEHSGRGCLSERVPGALSLFFYTSLFYSPLKVTAFGLNPLRSKRLLWQQHQYQHCYSIFNTFNIVDSMLSVPSFTWPFFNKLQYKHLQCNKRTIKRCLKQTATYPKVYGKI